MIGAARHLGHIDLGNRITGHVTAINETWTEECASSGAAASLRSRFGERERTFPFAPSSGSTARRNRLGAFFGPRLMF